MQGGPLSPHSAQHLLSVDFFNDGHSEWWGVAPNCCSDHSEYATESHRPGWGQPPWLLRGRSSSIFTPSLVTLSLSLLVLSLYPVSQSVLVKQGRVLWQLPFLRDFYWGTASSSPRSSNLGWPVAAPTAEDGRDESSAAPRSGLWTGAASTLVSAGAELPGEKSPHSVGSTPRKGPGAPWKAEGSGWAQAFGHF